MLEYVLRYVIPQNDERPMNAENYAVLLFFYFFVGMLRGVCNGMLEAKSDGKAVRYEGMSLIFGVLAFGYGVIGLGLMRFDTIFPGLLVLLLWFVGGLFGKSISPLADRGMFTFVFGAALGVLFLYHRVL